MITFNEFRKNLITEADAPGAPPAPPAGGGGAPPPPPPAGGPPPGGDAGGLGGPPPGGDMGGGMDMGGLGGGLGGGAAPEVNTKLDIKDVYMALSKYLEKFEKPEK